MPGSKKMEYKSKFNGLEIYYDKRWQAFDIKNQYISKLSNEETIRNQVANLQLPEDFSRV